MTDTQLQSKTLYPSLTTFEEINEYFKTMYGLSLFMQEEPYLMDGKKPQYWVGLNSTEMALLKANGDFTTKYPKKAKMTKNAGHRCITLNTLRRNLQKGRILFMKA